MLEVACRLAVELVHVLHAEPLQQLGQDDAAHGVDCVYRHAEVCRAYRLNIDQRQSQHGVDVLSVVCVVLTVCAEPVDLGIVEVLGFGYRQHLVSFFLVQELTLLVQQLQRVPLLGVVRCRQDYAATGTFHRHCHLGRGRCRQTYVHDIPAHSHQCACHDITHHASRDACVATHDNPVVPDGTGAAYQ